MTLARTTFGTPSLTRQALLVLGGSAFIALAAQISVPMYPVPVTLQTLAILIVGLSYGARLGTLTLLAYLAQGAAGLPVFAGGLNGVALLGPTAGFLVGFVGMVAFVGFAADRGWTRRVVPAALVCSIACAALYIPGVAWPMALAGALGLTGDWVGLGAETVWQAFVAPFLIGDVVKAVIAAVLVTGAATTLRGRNT